MLTGVKEARHRARKPVRSPAESDFRPSLPARPGHRTSSITRVRHALTGSSAASSSNRLTQRAHWNGPKAHIVGIARRRAAQPWLHAAAPGAAASATSENPSVRSSRSATTSSRAGAEAGLAAAAEIRPVLRRDASQTSCTIMPRDRRHHDGVGPGVDEARMGDAAAAPRTGSVDRGSDPPDRGRSPRNRQSRAPRRRSPAPCSRPNGASRAPSVNRQGTVSNAEILVGERQRGAPAIGAEPQVRVGSCQIVQGDGHRAVLHALPATGKRSGSHEEFVRRGRV